MGEKSDPGVRAAMTEARSESSSHWLVAGSYRSTLASHLPLAKLSRRKEE